MTTLRIPTHPRKVNPIPKVRSDAVILQAKLVKFRPEPPVQFQVLGEDRCHVLPDAVGDVPRGQQLVHSRVDEREVRMSARPSRELISIFGRQREPLAREVRFVGGLARGV
eukprot:CAMPEP_0196218414 /NCGR_PEP_ID=MMETSP0912-20130531/36493_1 /TAXON_ID=49265 /ORGANISM="Thalassiosira rotula, Strain GSO102" /LENGTH=110 /DNA_ID=CAMNT_0041496079 /DNA_START=214 /DNA_END=546 /DNA_ORIENTATION=-